MSIFKDASSTDAVQNFRINELPRPMYDRKMVPMTGSDDDDRRTGQV